MNKYLFTWMSVRVGERGHNDDAETGWKESFSSDSESLVWNRDDLPIQVLFAAFVTAAPVDVTLAVSLDGPIGLLALFGAVGPLLATATLFDGKIADFEAISTVPDDFRIVLGK